ncbi:MAG TPA: discoidin domain-containing protein, partial [Candidatus Dormibacteraeota bacterium]|nr:discoidin domain-containing protein [Candidatus Dormibacteraeota bacterium]
MLGFALGSARAQDLSLPPRAQWRASGSSGVQPKMPPAYAIDGDDSTEWGGEFSPGNYLQIDLGRSAAIGGALIHWDAAFATSYLILVSQDGEQWQTAYQTADSRGGMDYVFFPEVHARYLRLASAPSTTDWGVAVFEFEPLATRESPQIRGVDLPDPTALWSATASGRIGGRSVLPGTRELHVLLPRPLPAAG